MEAYTDVYKAANLIESILYLENQALGLPQLTRKTGLTRKIVLAAIEIIRKEYFGKRFWEYKNQEQPLL